MPEDPTLDQDRPSSAIPPVPVRPPVEPREFESLEDPDPAHAAGNADDGTQAS